eukprot:3718916-Alexandrium_andersonii.AAC.1
MARSPFGVDGVSLRWPYLGGVVGTRAVVGDPPMGRWFPPRLAAYAGRGVAQGAGKVHPARSHARRVLVAPRRPGRRLEHLRGRPRVPCRWVPQ